MARSRIARARAGSSLDAWKQLPKALEGYVVASVLTSEVDQRAIEPEMAPKRAPESRTALCMMVSKTGWMSVGEPADDSQDLTRRRLLIERLGEVAVTFLPVR